MEGLIFALVLMAIASFFNKKKGEEEDAQQPKRPAGQQRPTNQQRPQRQASPNRNTGQGGAFKKFEDYAKEIYGELQSQMNENPEKTEQAKKKVDQAVQQIPKREVVQPAPNRDTGRLSAHNSRPAASEKTVLKDELFPFEAEDIQKGIIMAEILLPPKSKR